jgi:hypothetical protein
MGAVTPIPPREECPAVDQVNTFSGKIVPPQIPFNRMEASSQPGDARAAGALAPQEHVLLENFKRFHALKH